MKYKLYKAVDGRDGKLKAWVVEPCDWEREFCVISKNIISSDSNASILSWAISEVEFINYFHLGGFDYAINPKLIAEFER